LGTLELDPADLEPAPEFNCARGYGGGGRGKEMTERHSRKHDGRAAGRNAIAGQESTMLHTKSAQVERNEDQDEGQWVAMPGAAKESKATAPSIIMCHIMTSSLPVLSVPLAGGTPMKMSPSEEEEEEKPRKKQYPKGMCDRCDGPHLTDACPIYKEKRNTIASAFAKRNPAVKPGNSSVGLSVGGFTRSSDFVRTGEGWAKGAKGVGAKGVGVGSGSDGFSSRALAEIHERSHQRSVPEPCRKQSSYSSSSSEGSDSEWKPEKKKSGGSGRSNTRETAAPRGGAYICTYIHMYGDIHAYIRTHTPPPPSEASSKHAVANRC
jgi:hypothetical protein